MMKRTTISKMTDVKTMTLEPANPARDEAAAKLQALLAEARAVLQVATDIAEQHDLSFEFFGVECSGAKAVELDANYDQTTTWDSSGCSFGSEDY